MGLPVVKKGTLLVFPVFFLGFFSFVFLIIRFSGFSVGGLGSVHNFFLLFIHSLFFFFLKVY